MSKPVLVIMAAGMGSRYGGLKQLDPVGGHGQLIIDYSIYDARRAGFETVIFVIKPEIEADFKAAIGDRVARVMDVRYAYQLKEDLPDGYAVRRNAPSPGAPPMRRCRCGRLWTDPLPSSTLMTITARRPSGRSTPISAPTRTGRCMSMLWWATY